MNRKFSPKSFQATMTKVFLLSHVLFTSFQAEAQFSEPCPKIGDGESCPAGCWLLETEIVFPFAKRQCSSVGYGYFSKANDNTRQACSPGSFSNTLNAQVCQQCEAGTYASSEGSRSCELCPAGSFSAVPGSDYCRPCLDDYYDQDGANAVELRDDEYYCTYRGSPTTSVAPTTSPSEIPTELVVTPAPSTVPTAGQSIETTYVASSEPTSTPYDMPSTLPSSMGDDSVVVSNEEMLLPHSICGDGRFEWHGSCKQCPSKIEEGLYPFLIVFLFVTLIIVLQSLVPLCSTGTVWVGMEYLQVLYLVSLSGISWSPYAAVVFEKVIPIFALDFSANFSVQCVFGWPKEYDQILTITLPLFFWLAMATVSKLSRERLVVYKSGLRWLTVYMYLGFSSLLQTSRDATELNSVFNTFFLRLASTTWYAAIAGLIGLVFYGLVFPYWLYRCLGRYYKLVVLGIEDEELDGIETQASRSCFQKIKRNVNSSQASLFLTLAIFPAVREGASWWSLFWLIRRMAFLVLVAFFPRSPFLLLVALLNILFFSEVFQRCKMPFPNEYEENLGNKWYHTEKADTVLQMCAVAMVGISFLIVGSDGSRYPTQDLTIDILVILLLSASVLFWMLTIGFASRHSCEDYPRFATKANELLLEMAVSQRPDEDKDQERSIAENFENVSLDDPPSKEYRVNSPESKPISKRSTWVPAGFVPTLNDLSKTSSREEEIVLDGSDRHYPPQRVFRQDSIMSNLDNASISREDEATVVEEIWIDEETGKEVQNRNGRNWADAETGMRVA
ncbi:ephrin-receptor like protein [Nitzschia inconspicua]|uniref:Ephrin-receptor like protein n=1 Tax=Nitzschia inconspicua TaxID=303405 RepID=A0A9K3LUT9_9STRA|nr:ephrin-receptor like protein [Nitzschia inconspicua]